MPNPLSSARGFRPACLWVLLVLFNSVLSTSPTLAADPLPLDSPADVTFDAEQLQLEISSIDHEWQLQLTPRQLLGSSSLLQEALHDLPQFYSGVLVGDDGSWARISHDERGQGTFSGHVFTRGLLYELKYFDSMGGHTLAELGGASLEKIPLPETPKSSLPGTDPSKLSTNQQASATAFPAPRAIKIGIVVDSRYNEYHDQQGLAHALSIINGVDGLYQSQLGLAVVVDSFKVYEDPAQDPLRDFQGSVDQILEEFREIRTADADLPAELALVHLFSGHDDPDKIIGLGWINTACRLDGYDLSVSTPFPYDMLLSAHEIAHNLGAEHDDGVACMTDNAITGSEIMWSELSGSTQPVFSSCSLVKMQPALNASCVTDNIDVGVDLDAQASGTPYRMDVTITAINADTARTVSRAVSTTDFPASTQLSEPSAGCTVQGSRLSCQHNALAARGSQAVSVSAEFPVDGDPQALVTTELSPGGFSDTEQLNNRAALQIDLESASSTSLNMAVADDGSGGSADAPPTTGFQSGGSAGDTVAVGSADLLSLLCAGLFALCIRLTRKNRFALIG